MIGVVGGMGVQVDAVVEVDMKVEGRRRREVCPEWELGRRNVKAAVLGSGACNAQRRRRRSLQSRRCCRRQMSGSGDGSNKSSGRGAVAVGAAGIAARC